MPSLERRAALYIIAEQNGLVVNWVDGSIREKKP